MKRRAVMEAVGGAGLLAIAAATFAAPDARGSAPEPDAELIRLCAEFNATERRYQGLHGDGDLASLSMPEGDERDAALAAMEDRRDDLLDQICDAQATTHAGFMARAQMLALYSDKALLRNSGCYDNRMLFALLRDMTGGRWA